MDIAEDSYYNPEYSFYNYIIYLDIFIWKF